MARARSIQVRGLPWVLIHLTDRKQCCLPVGVGRGREASLKAAGCSGLVLPWVSYRSVFIAVWPAEHSLHPPRVAKLLLFPLAFEPKGVAHPMPSCPLALRLLLTPQGQPGTLCGMAAPLGSCFPTALRGSLARGDRSTEPPRHPGGPRGATPGPGHLGTRSPEAARGPPKPPWGARCPPSPRRP